MHDFLSFGDNCVIFCVLDLFSLGLVFDVLVRVLDVFKLPLLVVIEIVVVESDQGSTIVFLEFLDSLLVDNDKNCSEGR